MHLLLYVSEINIEAVSFQRGVVVDQQTFEKSAIADFINTQNKNTRVSIVLDTIEEMIQTEYVPSLLPWEKPSLVKRLVDKNKQKAAYAQRFIWTGINKVNADQRKEELLISHIVTPSDELTHLVDLIQKKQLIWIGFHSAAELIKQYLFKHLKSQEGLTAQQLKQPLLLFAKMSATHYRQCFFYQGYLQLTRLIPYETGSADESKQQQFLVNEARLASRFIYNQGLLSRENSINYIIIDRVGEVLTDSLKQMFKEEGLFNANQSGALPFLTVHQITDTNKDACFWPSVAEQVKRGLTPSFYALNYINASNGFRLGRLLIFLMALATLIAFSMASINGGLQHYFLEQKAELLAKTEAVLEEKKEVLLAQARGRESVIDMEAIVQFTTEISRLNRLEPYGLDLSSLSAVLQQHPNLRLSSLHWRPLDKIDDEIMQVTVTGEVFPFKGQFRPMNQIVEDFAEALQRLPTVTQMTITREPFSQQQATSFRTTRAEDGGSLPFTMTWQQARHHDSQQNVEVEP